VDLLDYYRGKTRDQGKTYPRNARQDA
jgi:hypothetical protein